VDVAGGKINEGLRAGDGAANAVADSYGRILVTDARAGALIAFSASPLIMRQRYPVPGGAYGIAYDAKRSLAWVTLTERNEVVGFDVRGGEPVEKYRFPTVRQPDSVGVDETSGRVVIGSAVGEGTQVIQP
jgi:DNA-binding beta-propeller fold protein YncE